MASQLREVLNQFTEQQGALSVNALARHMDIEPGMLRSMIDYWVRKGKLREVSSNSSACQTCGISGACPFVVAMPVYYEVVQDTDEATDVPCSCGGQCSM